MTVNQLHQALRTYTTQWVSWAMIVFWLLAHGLSFVLRQSLDEAVWMSFVLNVMLGTGIGAMVKIQFSDPRARLLPGFRAAHLAAAGVIIGVAIATVIILTRAWTETGTLLALPGLTLLALVAGAWGTYSKVSVHLLLFGLVIFAPMLAPQLLADSTQALLSRPTASLGIVAVGLVALAALGVRLWTLCEENPEYSKCVPGDWDDVTSRVGNRNQRQLEARVVRRSRFLMWSLDLLFRLVVRPESSPGWMRRLLLRQLAGGFASLSMIPSFVIIMLMVFWLQSGSGARFEALQSFFVAFFPLQIVVGMVGCIWVSRWALLAPESLRPVNRREFVRDQARCLAWDMAPGAVAHCLMIFVYLRLIHPDSSPDHLLPWLVLTIGQYLVAYCLMFWLVSTGSYLVLVLGTVGTSFLSAVLVIAALFAEPGSWSPLNLVVAGIATALGAMLLYRLAFRRWCHIDLA